MTSRPLARAHGLVLVILLTAVGVAIPAAASRSAQKPRARDLGIYFEGNPGSLNAITDVAGVSVGHTTIIEGSGALEVGEGPVRTGVTVVFPREDATDPVFAGWFSLNGNGEMTGTTWVEESGFLEGPVAITNTHSVGVVHDAVIGWQARTGTMNQAWSLPVVGETWDGWLNDINGFHVEPEHVFEALGTAASGPVAEGAVGGGTGMICYGFKGGIGTSSRVFEAAEATYTVGVLVQANFGGRRLLRIDGVPVGRELIDVGREAAATTAAGPASAPESFDPMSGDGSIIVVVATDAPLLSHQLKRLARRVSLGIARTGSVSSNGSGDIFIAFSTANAGAARAPSASVAMLGNSGITPVFEAVVQATEEAIINALVAAETMTGRDDHVIEALPHDRLQEVMRRYGRLQ